MTERELWQAAIDMLNEIHLRMGTELVYKLKLERLAVDKIAQAHITKAYQQGLDDGYEYAILKERG